MPSGRHSTVMRSRVDRVGCSWSWIESSKKGTNTGYHHMPIVTAVEIGRRNTVENAIAQETSATTMTHARARAHARELFCPHHGAIKAEDAIVGRGHRNRCPVQGCGRFIGKVIPEQPIGMSSNSAGGGQAQLGAGLVMSKIAEDPEILVLLTEREKVRIRREIRELQAPLEFDHAIQRLSELERCVQEQGRVILLMRDDPLAGLRLV